MILLPLLGLTWLFGFLAVNKESMVFAWIFTLLNSLQVCTLYIASYIICQCIVGLCVGCFYISFACDKK